VVRLVVAAVVLAASVLSVPTKPVGAAAIADDDWLHIVNTYRAMSGLAPVTSNAAWSAEAQAHSCYMLQNGISHDEVPGRPGYTTGGDVAGNSGNVAVSSSLTATARDHIDLWMTGPFHAIGILRHNLKQSGFGLCADENTPTPWRSGGTLDVVRGVDTSARRPTAPITFPGNGATVPLNAFITEFPNPMTLCGWKGNAGLPLIAMMPNNVTSASATLRGPQGPIETCVLHASNTGADATAQAILEGDNAVVVMPRTTLEDGAYDVSVVSDGGTTSWRFNVDTTTELSFAPPGLPDTAPAATSLNFVRVEPFRLVDTRRTHGASRLLAGQTVRVDAGRSRAAAVSVNVTTVNATAPGHLTLFPCGQDVPTVSTASYTPHAARANQAIVPLQRGDFCIYAHADVDVVLDVNGYFEADSPAQFTPIEPMRVYDTRESGDRLEAGVERKLPLSRAIGEVPAEVAAAALNVTVIGDTGFGHIQVYPCGSPRSLETSTVNYSPGEATPNVAIVGTDPKGNVCVKALTDVHVVVDVTGYFGSGAGYDFTSLTPIRLFDSRDSFRGLNDVTEGRRVQGGDVVKLRIAGKRGVPVDAKAVSVNLTATQPQGPLHVTMYPCGPTPGTSTLNAASNQTAANGAIVQLSSQGELCLLALSDVHLIVDINGIWS